MPPHIVGHVTTLRLVTRTADHHWRAQHGTVGARLPQDACLVSRDLCAPGLDCIYFVELWRLRKQAGSFIPCKQQAIQLQQVFTLHW